MVVDYLFCIKFLGINLEKICILRQLQNAYISEKGDAVGTWYLIGYNGPGEWVSGSEAKSKKDAAGASTESTNFTYTDKLEAKTLSSLTAATLALSINNKNKLNDCDVGTDEANWTVSIAAGAEGTSAGEAAYTSEVKGAGCDALTPNFGAIK